MWVGSKEQTAVKGVNRSIELHSSLGQTFLYYISNKFYVEKGKRNEGGRGLRGCSCFYKKDIHMHACVETPYILSSRILSSHLQPCSYYISIPNLQLRNLTLPSYSTPHFSSHLTVPQPHYHTLYSTFRASHNYTALVRYRGFKCKTYT